MTEAFAVELKITDREPFRSFITAVASAAGLLCTDMEALTGTIRQAAEDLRAACEALGASIPHREGPDASYRGVIVIEWPAAYGYSPYSSMPGALISVTDSVTGKPIRTVLAVTVRADPACQVTADLTMLSDEDGGPLLDGEPVPDGDGFFRTGVYPFFVSEMRVRER